MLTLAVALSLLILPAGAASTPEEALGEVNIYSGGYSMNYLPSTAGCRPSRIPTFSTATASGRRRKSQPIV